MLNYKKFISKLVSKEHALLFILVLASLVFGSIEYGVKTTVISVIVLYSMITIITNIIGWFFEFIDRSNQKDNKLSSFNKIYSLISSIIVIIILSVIDEKLRNYILIFCVIFLTGILIIYLLKKKYKSNS
jgi:Na+/H+-translocating membrane pyrophosphatase